MASIGIKTSSNLSVKPNVVYSFPVDTGEPWGARKLFRQLEHIRASFFCDWCIMDQYPKDTSELLFWLEWPCIHVSARYWSRWTLVFGNSQILQELNITMAEAFTSSFPRGMTITSLLLQRKCWLNSSPLNSSPWRSCTSGSRHSRDANFLILKSPIHHYLSTRQICLATKCYRLKRSILMEFDWKDVLRYLS